jgi:hypothetical protein
MKNKILKNSGWKWKARSKESGKQRKKKGNERTSEKVTKGVEKIRT